jgi:uncharacterized repeat protein (TIGR03803 family)
MQVRQLISVAFVLAVCGCSAPTPQPSSGTAALPARSMKWASSSSSGTVTVLYNFQGEPDGADPQGRVSVEHSCTDKCTTKIFGNTSEGGTNNAGTIYSLYSGNLTTGEPFTEHVLLSYTPSETGDDPTGPILALQKGPFFGMASQGGAHGKGTVVELKGLKGANAVLSFNGRNGAFPAGGLIVKTGYTDAYLTATSAGGADDLGAIVSVERGRGKLLAKVVYSFTGQSNGEHPNSDLTGGNVVGESHYGTTAGSTSVPATVYAFVPGQGLTTLYTFENSADGATPDGVSASFSSTKVTLFGTTLKGGPSGEGTLYELKPDGSTYTMVTLHNFAGGGADGAYPYGPPIYTGGSDPSLWLVTQGGGSHGCGTIFSYDLTSGEHALLYSFTCGADGAYPKAPMIPDVIYGGLYYGTTSAGGTKNRGIVFSFKP